tara:strand:- start:497 stop:1141 length:645 start_codon:yes stop_codon:yes gene_type:complete
LKLKLYSNSHSVSCSKIEVALDFKSIEVDKVEAINNYASFSPTATVPSLAIDDRVISDSGVILEFLEENSPHPSLLSDNAAINAQIRFMAKLVDEKLVSSIRKLFGLVKNTSHPSDNLMINNIFNELEAHLNLLLRIKEDNIFLASSSLSLADCGTPAFFSMLKEFEIHFNHEIKKSDDFLKYEKSLNENIFLNKEYKRYGFEIRNWISNKLLA